MSSRYPIVFRPGSSDLQVYRQVFIEDEYKALAQIQTAGLIVDCGANVGYSAAYFLTRYPNATVIAVEPDPDNFGVLRRNTARFGSRIKAMQAGIWSHACGLKVERLGPGAEWGITVRECHKGETPDVPAVDLGSLLRTSGFDRIAILKMDIERSEYEVFRAGYGEWLDQCDAIAIELHGPECEDRFQEAIKGQGFRLGRSGELTICVRDRRPADVSHEPTA